MGYCFVQFQGGTEAQQTADDMVQVREVGRDADGMDIALAMARDLYQAAALAVRQGYSSPEERREVEALADIRCG